MKKVFTLVILISVFFAAHASSSDFGEVDIHGFISQGYLKTDHINFLAETKDGTFQFNEFAINFTTILSPGLRAGMQLFGYDLGERGNDEINLEWCYADYQYRKWLGLRVGSLKINNGLYNEIRDLDFLRTSIFLPHSIYSEMMRDELQSLKGVGLYGNVNMGDLGNLFYIANIGQMAFCKNKGFAEGAEMLYEREFSKYNVIIDADVEDIGAGYVSNGVLRWYTFLDGLVLGITGFNVNNLDLTVVGALRDLPVTLKFYTQSTKFWGTTGTVQYSFDNFVITWEYSRSDSVNFSIDDPGNAIKIYGVSGATTKDCILDWYINFTYRVSEFFEFGYTYSEHFPDKNDRTGSKYKNSGIAGNMDYLAWAKSSVFSLRFDMNSNWITKFEYTYTDGQALFNNEINEEFHRYWGMYAFKLTYQF